MKKKIIILAVLLVVALVQLSCSTKPAEELLCWNTGGRWLCDDMLCETGHCERPESGKEIGEPLAVVPISAEEQQCFEDRKVWICDVPDCSIGHCEDLSKYQTAEERACYDGGGVWVWEDRENRIGYCADPALYYATEAPIGESDPADGDDGGSGGIGEVDPGDTPLDWDPSVGGVFPVGELTDECDARDRVTVTYIPGYDGPGEDGYRDCSYQLVVANNTAERLIFALHYVRFDPQYPDQGPEWTVKFLSGDNYIEQENSLFELGRFSTYAGQLEYWYTDQIALIHTSCYEDYYESIQNLPVEYVEMYAFDVPYMCTP